MAIDSDYGKDNIYYYIFILRILIYKSNYNILFTCVLVQHQTEVAFSFLCEVANKFHNISFTSIEINENLSIPLHTTTLDDVIAENITNV